MEFPHLEKLTRAGCRQLLPGATVGRLAVVGGHFPVLEPVSFAIVEDDLVVAVRAGSAGAAVAPGTVVTFEADVLDHATRQGWSVVVSGPVHGLDAASALRVGPQLQPWPAATSDRLLLIRSERVTGQRVTAQPHGPTRPTGSPAGTAAPTTDTARPLARPTLDEAEALARLERGGQQVGRLVVTMGGTASVFPVNYAVDGDAVVFRTASGTKLSAITRSMVTFEVDDIDATGRGWAVTVEGLAQELLEADPPALQARIAATTFDTWPGGSRPHVVRITPYRISGTAWVPAPVPAGAAGR